MNILMIIHFVYFLINIHTIFQSKYSASKHPENCRIPLRQSKNHYLLEPVRGPKIHGPSDLTYAVRAISLSEFH